MVRKVVVILVFLLLILVLCGCMYACVLVSRGIMVRQSMNDAQDYAKYPEER